MAVGSISSESIPDSPSKDCIWATRLSKALWPDGVAVAFAVGKFADMVDNGVRRCTGVGDDARVLSRCGTTRSGIRRSADCYDIFGFFSFWDVCMYMWVISYQLRCGSSGYDMLLYVYVLEGS